MSVITRRKAYLVALALAAMGAAAAQADEPTRAQLYNGPVFHPPGNPNAAACAAGFTAAPSTIQGANKYNQSYTCTGPQIVCSTYFSPEDSVAGTIPAKPGQLLGQTIYGSPVTIEHGRMVYTCVEPPAPPQ